MNRKAGYWLLTLCLSWSLLAAPVWGALPPRVVAEYTDQGYQSYLGSVTKTAAGNFLVTRNGFHEPRVLELSPTGEALWEFGPIQANSASLMENGHVLIADSGAPGYPLMPRVIEVNRAGEILWSYQLPSRAESPRLARELPGDRFLLVLNQRVVEIDRQGGTLWQFDGLYYPLWAERLVTGETLIVDRGFYGGKVLLADERGRVVWQYGQYGKPGASGPLAGPVWAAATDAGVLIADQGAARLIKVSGEQGEVIDQWAEVLNHLPVASRWTVLPDLAHQEIYLSLTLSGGRSVLWQVQKGIKTFLGQEAYQWQNPPLVLDGELYGSARELLGLLGAEFSWQAEIGGLKISQGGREWLVVPADSTDLPPGEKFIAGPLRLQGGTSFLSLTFMQEYLGLDYRWDAEVRELRLLFQPDNGPGDPGAGEI